MWAIRRETSRPVKSHSSTKVTAGISRWARVTCSTIARRIPRTGTRRPSASGAAARTSASTIRPPGPLPCRPTSSTPSERASCRTAGVARTAAVGSDGTTETSGSDDCSETRCRLDGAQELLALGADHDEHGADRRDLALLDEDLEHRALPRRGDLDGGLVGLHLDERLILRDRVALRDEPARDLGLGQPLAEIGQLELVRHGGAGYSDVSTTVRAPIGRDEELGAIARLLDDPAQLPAAVVLWGDAGIGKTSIWLAGLEAAAERGYRTLSSRPSEAEARLSYAGLADLLGAVAGVVLPELPPIQQRALEGALLLGASEAPVDERAIGAAFLQALRVLAAAGPVCLAVDDLQWLDPPSLAALQFALTRLGDHPSRRSSRCAATCRRGCVAASRSRACERSRSTGLSVGAMQQLLQHAARCVVPATDVAQALGHLGREPVLRARAGRRARAARRHARSGRRAPDPGRSGRAPARAPRRARPACQGRRAGRGGGRRADHRSRGGGSRRPGGGRAVGGARRAHRRPERRAPPLHPSAARLRGRRAPDADAPTHAARPARGARSDPRAAGAPSRARDGRAGPRRSPRRSRRRRGWRRPVALRRPPPSSPSRRSG